MSVSDGQRQRFNLLLLTPACVLGRNYGQAERAIRTSKLNVLPRLHLWPINVVVYDGPS